MANVRNALAGFGAGFFGGYRDVLKLKMEEDLQAKRDEATFNRTKNLKELEMSQQQGQFEEGKALSYAQLDEQKRQHDQTYDINKQQLEVQKASAAASAAGAAASRDAAAAQREYLNKRLEMESPEGQAKSKRAASVSFYKEVEKDESFKNEGDRATVLSLIKLTGASTQEELAAKMSGDRGTVKEVADLVEKTVTPILSQSPEDVKIAASAIVGKKVGNVADAHSIILDHYTSVFSNSFKRNVSSGSGLQGMLQGPKQDTPSKQKSYTREVIDVDKAVETLRTAKAEERTAIMNDLGKYEEGRRAVNLYQQFYTE